MKKNVFTHAGKALVGKVPTGEDLKTNIDQSVAIIGGFQKLVKAGDTILIKPNFNTADPPPASSDPAFVKAVIELLYHHGAAKVTLGESSMFRLSTRETLRVTGMLEAATSAGAEIVPFDEGEWVQVETGGRYLRKVSLARASIEATKIVYVCCLKTHRWADFTMSLKLAMGFVKTRDRLKMHVRQLKHKLVDLNLAIAPDLIIMDGRRCFISGGPEKGELREPGIILTSGDQVAIDVEALKIIQSFPGHSLKGDPWQVTMIQRAVELGLGASNERAYDVVSTVSEGQTDPA